VLTENSNDPDSLLRDLELGEEARRFLNTTLGKFIVEQAEAEIRDAVIALQIVKPTDDERIRELQNTIKIARSIPDWLDLAMQRGNQAYQNAMIQVARERE
jgi:hypothetical protein